MSRLGLRVSKKLPPGTAGHATTLCVAAALCSVLTAASIDAARAADWPLRGSIEPAGYVRWDGWQFGVQAGYSNMTTLSSDTTNGPLFGAFLGYNVQWDQLVVGFDLAYKHPSFLDSSTALSTFKLVDYATLRGRAGYAFGQFLPYAVLGIAVGRFNYGDTVLGTFTGKDSAFDAGFVAGLGVDWAVTPRMFLRAEWEYIAFASINRVTASTNTGLIGVGVRF
jgi:outer membrane immunogenic protein